MPSVLQLATAARRRLIRSDAGWIGSRLLLTATILALPPLLVAKGRFLPEALTTAHLPTALGLALVLTAWLVWCRRPPADAGARAISRSLDDHEAFLTAFDLAHRHRESALAPVLARRVAEQLAQRPPRPAQPRAQNQLWIPVLLLLVVDLVLYCSPHHRPEEPGRDRRLEAFLEAAAAAGPPAARELARDLAETTNPEARRRLAESALKANEAPLTDGDLRDLLDALRRGDNQAARIQAEALVDQQKQGRDLTADAAEALRLALTTAAEADPDSALAAGLRAAAELEADGLGSGTAAALGSDRSAMDATSRATEERERRRIALTVLSQLGAGAAEGIGPESSDPAAGERSKARLVAGGTASLVPSDRAVAERYLARRLAGGYGR